VAWARGEKGAEGRTLSFLKGKGKEEPFRSSRARALSHAKSRPTLLLFRILGLLKGVEQPPQSGSRSLGLPEGVEQPPQSGSRSLGLPEGFEQPHSGSARGLRVTAFWVCSRASISPFNRTAAVWVCSRASSSRILGLLRCFE